MVPYIAMGVVSLAALLLAWATRQPRRVTLIAGAIAWIVPALYFFVEAIVISGTTKPYSVLWQPMSDLGVTTCDANELALLTSRDICSPLHGLMNWTFTLVGVAILIGAIWLHAWWPRHGRGVTAATILLVIFGISGSTLPGIIPADLHFTAHVVTALPGMVVQIPALLLLASAIRPVVPALATWTRWCGILSAVSFALLFVQPWLAIPGGLLQRALYGFIYLWGAVAGVWLWRYWNRVTNLRCQGVSTACRL